MKTRQPTRCRHPDRLHYAKGLCHSCYHTERYRTNEKHRENVKRITRRCMKRKWHDDPKYRAKKTAYMKEYMKEYRKKNKEKFRAYDKKQNDKRREKK